jgi:RNA polymerase sigma factor (sigma-70 family)
MGPTRLATGGREWLCKCDCGEAVWRRGAVLRRGLKSCGKCDPRARIRGGWGTTRHPNGSPSWWDHRVSGSSMAIRGKRGWVAKGIVFTREILTTADRLDESMIPDDGMTPEESLLFKEETQAIVYGLSRIKPNRANVLRLRFGIGGGGEMTLDECAALLGLTRERIRQIEQRALGQLRGEMLWLRRDHTRPSPRIPRPPGLPISSGRGTRHCSLCGKAGHFRPTCGRASPERGESPAPERPRPGSSARRPWPVC